MKTFKQYIKDGKGYPPSYERNSKLMSLVKKYDDPFKFILAVLSAMSAGKLKLTRIGVANTREVAALWNAHKGKKISPTMIEQWLDEGVLSERENFVKGWTKKDKIISVTTDFSNYHIMQVTHHPRKFGLSDKKLLKILEDWYDDMSAPDPEREAKITLRKLIDGGEVDNSPPIEEYLFKKGYCRFVVDKAHGSIEGQTEKECREGAKALDNDYLPFEKDGFKLFEIKPVRGKPKYITNKLDWYDWIQGKAKRKYVSKMAQFREATKHAYPASYEKNPLLNKLVDKHSDPLKFVLDVITQMSQGKLKLRRIGVANTREVVAFWNSKKKRQIKPSYVMEMLGIKTVKEYIDCEADHENL